MIVFAAHRPRLDLGGARLSGKDLSGANLSETNLSGADLTKTDLSNANLRDADLSYATLDGAVLTRANLADALLLKTKLANAMLIERGQEPDYRQSRWAVQRRSRYDIPQRRQNPRIIPPRCGCSRELRHFDEIAHRRRLTVLQCLHFVQHKRSGLRRPVV